MRRSVAAFIVLVAAAPSAWAGEQVADAIARGAVETGATAVTELGPNQGVQIIGPVPTDVLDWSSTTSALLGSRPRNANEAREFLLFLKSAAATKAFQAIGLNPPS